MRTSSSLLFRPWSSRVAVGPEGLAGLTQGGVAGALLIDLAINWGGWAVASLLKTEKFYDLLGSVSFISTAVYTLATGPATPRQLLATGMVCTWAGRLGSMLYQRIHRCGNQCRGTAEN